MSKTKYPNPWNRRVRALFWIVGVLCGGILTYTTRHFINGDAIAYLDMAEAFRTGFWSQSVLLGYSPGYSFLLAIFNIIFPPSPGKELFLAKYLNFMIFLAAMAACDLFVRRLIDELDRDSRKFPLPSQMIMAMCFSAFLVTSLIWVRIQIVAPDMLVFIFVLLSVTIILNIKRSPTGFRNFILLGLTSGLGYICKTFFLPFSLIFFVFSGCYCLSLRRAAPRLLSAIMVMLIVGSPVIISQSLEAGRLSIGEVGNYNYAFFVAGQGAKIHGPSVIHHNPDILYYDHGVLSTYPHGDPAYWALGIRPVFNLRAQLNAIRGSLEQLLGGILWPTIVLFLWFVGQLRVATFVPLKFFPPSTFVMLVVICLAGTATYCLVIMEMRYIASFLFLGFAALVTALRYKPSLLDERSSILLQAVAVIGIFLVMVAHFIVDQSLRSLYNSETKVSHRETFVDMCAIKNSLEAHGIVRGDRVAVFSPINCKLYWAKIAGVRVMAEIMDVNKFLEYSPEDRKKAIDTLNKNGFKAIVVKQPRFAKLGKEGWIESPGSHGYYLNFLDSQVK